MATSKTTGSTTSTTNDQTPGVDAVEKKVAAQQEQGYRGKVIDPTPNRAYTVAGRVDGDPTPETDSDAADEARKARG